MVPVKKAGKAVSRPIVSKAAIILSLRRRIASGELSPGSRLPTQRALRRELNANIVTVGRAIDQLKADGFIATEGARGTFVTAHPPHLFRYALVFPSHPSDLSWPRNWEALAKEAAAIQQEGTFDIPVYYDVDNENRGISVDCARLLGDVRAHRLAGVIFASHPWVVKGTPLLDEPGIPRVAFMEPEPATYPNVASVTTAVEALIDRSLDYLASKGRKRLGIMTLPKIVGEHTETIRQKAAARGLETRPYWTQSVSELYPISARACVHVMMRSGQADRPDALLITDDNLVEQATGGLLDAGVRAPKDVDVVVHCNFPWPTSSAVPVTRIGFDALHILKACIKSIDEQRLGGVIPSPVTIPALFEDELSGFVAKSISSPPTSSVKDAVAPSKRRGRQS